MSITPLDAADEFFFARLTADATLAALGVYTDEVPAGASYPLVHVRCLPESALNRAVIGDDITHTSARYVVVVVHEFRSGPGSWQPLRDAASRIKTQLHQATLEGTASGGTVWRCSEEQVVRLFYERDGIRYRELGGLYRVLVEAV